MTNNWNQKELTERINYYQQNLATQIYRMKKIYKLSEKKINLLLDEAWLEWRDNPELKIEDIIEKRLKEYGK
jgi:hypothetical protein